MYTTSIYFILPFQKTTSFDKKKLVVFLAFTEITRPVEKSHFGAILSISNEILLICLNYSSIWHVLCGVIVCLKPFAWHLSKTNLSLMGYLLLEVDNLYLELILKLLYNIDSKQTEDIMRDYSFGNFLHELRTRRGLTQYQLGALVGVSDKAVSKWENGSSKPQSNILYKLSEILGISVDELLSCKYHVFEKKDARGVFAMKKQLWNKAFEKMCQRYGNPAPIEIINRFFSEQADMQKTDMIIYFDMLSTLTIEAKKEGEHIHAAEETGASLVAYLLGATEINPLKPHYYCPSCLAVIFNDNSEDGWDLSPKKCACGNEMHADGHHIPFEVYCNVVHRNTNFDISVSPRFMCSAKSVIQEYFKDCKLMLKEREPNKVITFIIDSEESRFTITLCADEELARYKSLEQVTAVYFDNVPFDCKDILNEFQKCNTDGLPEFKTDFMKNMLSVVHPGSFRDLIQILGLSHGTGVWIGNGDKLIEKCYPVGRLIAYRDDVFNYIQEKIIDKRLAYTGFAYKVMEDTRRGIYAKSCIPENIKSNLKVIGMEDWFINSISKIGYLFPKAQGVNSIKLISTMMWYKTHYPKEFNKIML